MAYSSQALPVPDGPTYLTTAGCETYMEYKKGFKFRHFCMFELLDNPAATDALRMYYRDILQVAQTYRKGTILCDIHYRASSDWGALVGYDPDQLDEISLRIMEFYQQLVDEHASADTPVLISNCIGPRGDAYQTNPKLTEQSAQDYHSAQINLLAGAGADLVTGLTLNSVPEAIGITRAAQQAGVPVVIAFTLDRTARLKTGPTLKQAIEQVDAATGSGPAYYMLNCIHPDDFEPALEPGDWIRRLNGIRPNASAMGKGILCKLDHLEQGDPVELGQQMGDLARRFPHISVWGGCCGTDAVHIGEICRNVVAVRNI
ncbi:MAG: homocysteine S-methyltransferase family protein [Paracoccaceae bacterium]